VYLLVPGLLKANRGCARHKPASKTLINIANKQTEYSLTQKFLREQLFPFIGLKHEL